MKSSLNRIFGGKVNSVMVQPGNNDITIKEEVFLTTTTTTIAGAAIVEEIIVGAARAAQTPAIVDIGQSKTQ